MISSASISASFLEKGSDGTVESAELADPEAVENRRGRCDTEGQGSRQTGALGITAVLLRSSPWWTRITEAYVCSKVCFTYVFDSLVDHDIC